MRRGGNKKGGDSASLFSSLRDGVPGSEGAGGGGSLSPSRCAFSRATTLESMARIANAVETLSVAAGDGGATFP